MKKSLITTLPDKFNLFFKSHSHSPYVNLIGDVTKTRFQMCCVESTRIRLKGRHIGKSYCDFNFVHSHFRQLGAMPGAHINLNTEP